MMLFQLLPNFSMADALWWLSPAHSKQEQQNEPQATAPALPQQANHNLAS